MDEAPVQALSVSIDNHLCYKVTLFMFWGDPPVAKVVRVVSEGQGYSWNYFEDVILKRIIDLAGSMNVFFIFGLKPGDSDSISRLAGQVLKDNF